MKNKLKWEKMIHLRWQEMDGLKKREPKLYNELSMARNLFYKWQYRSDKGHSIIGPSGATFSSWELLDLDGETHRFKTLKEAKKKAQLLFNSK